MKNTFFEYYTPTSEEFKSLWAECIYVLDANVLLNLYRYSTETSMALIDILSKVSERLRVPHQAALEYHKNRNNVISSQMKAYSIIEDNLEQCKKNLAKDLQGYRKDSILPIDEIKETIEHSFSEILKSIEVHKAILPNYLADDRILSVITELLSGKIGNIYSQEKLDELYKEGKQRYDKLIPPGFEDKNKPEPDKFGDLIVWYQIIDMAIELKRPIIFVTDDRKKDWWLEFEGKTIGPKRELLREISEKANIKFYMYNTDQFMRYSKEYIAKDVKDMAIEEVQNLRITDEIENQKQNYERVIRNYLEQKAKDKVEQDNINNSYSKDNIFYKSYNNKRKKLYDYNERVSLIASEIKALMNNENVDDVNKQQILERIIESDSESLFSDKILAEYYENLKEFACVEDSDNSQLENANDYFVQLPIPHKKK
jgi:hypothetical protein